MARYTVTWGEEEKIVYAENEQDAWAEYASGNGLAYRYPQLYDRTVEAIDEQEQEN